MPLRVIISCGLRHCSLFDRTAKEGEARFTENQRCFRSRIRRTCGTECQTRRYTAVVSLARGPPTISCDQNAPGYERNGDVTQSVAELETAAMGILMLQTHRSYASNTSRLRSSRTNKQMYSVTQQITRRPIIHPRLLAHHSTCADALNKCDGGLRLT